MKKLVPVSSLAAGVALSALTVSPAYAAPFANCTEANNAGVYDIPVGDPRYTPAQDRDNDGLACEPAPGTWDGAVTAPQPAAPEVSQPAAPEVSQPAAPAATEPWSWDNCSEAFANGVANIPAGTPGYGTHLDSDLDGIGCELNGDDSAGVIPANLTTTHDDTAGQTEVAHSEVAQGSQVEQMPVGGADTGVAVEQGAGFPSAAAGLGLAGLMAAAVGGVAFRRSRAS